jgi:3-oxoacyl-(acyl-carrier-protein) synthase
MPRREVFVTGIGIVSPAGATAAATKSALMAGCLAVQPLNDPAIPAEVLSFAGQVVDFVPPAGGQDLDRAGQFALAAASEALAAAGWGDGSSRTDGQASLSLCTGFSKPFLRSEDREGVFSAGSYCSPDRFLADRLRSTLGVPVVDTHTTVASCATGTHAIVRGCQMIEEGDSEAVLCGSVDTPLHPLWACDYRSMGILADPHPERGCAWACRPFDRTRDGLALGEGAAMLLLESAESVLRRAAQPVARLAGWALGSDPVGLTQVTETGEPLAHVIQMALDHSACRPNAIGCVHAHGTATPINDLAEINAIRSAFGQASTEVPVVSVKGSIGHLMGAAGAVESAVACLSVRHGHQPGNTTLIEADPAFQGVPLPRQPFQGPIGPVLKTSLGFGGHLAAIVVTPA